MARSHAHEREVGGREVEEHVRRVVFEAKGLTETRIAVQREVEVRRVAVAEEGTRVTHEMGVEWCYARKRSKEARWPTSTWMSLSDVCKTRD